MCTYSSQRCNRPHANHLQVSVWVGKTLVNHFEFASVATVFAQNGYKQCVWPTGALSTPVKPATMSTVSGRPYLSPLFQDSPLGQLPKQAVNVRLVALKAQGKEHDQSEAVTLSDGGVGKKRLNVLRKEAQTHHITANL